MAELVERDRTKKPWFQRNRNKQMDRIVYCDGDPSLEVVPFEQTIRKKENQLLGLTMGHSSTVLYQCLTVSFSIVTPKKRQTRFFRIIDI